MRRRSEKSRWSELKYIYIISISLLSVSCNAQEKSEHTTKFDNPIKEEIASQIGQYVTNIFEDSNGHLWFGTIGKGIAKYDGNRLKYFTKKEGLPTNRVTGIIEDSKGIFWLNTGEGLSKFDGKNFTNFSVNDDFHSNMISQLLIDSKGIFWIGTWGGVYKFNGKSFTSFPLPYPQVKTKINQDTKGWITEIKEDPEGNIWFARDGYGVCKYDGNSFTHVLKKDGIHSNNVTEVEIDKMGNIWFGTRVAEKDNPDPKKRVGKGGVNIYNGKTIRSFPTLKGLHDGDVYKIYRDKSDNIWISTTNNGVYRYDGEEFKNYQVPISIMSMTEDRDGNLWLGGAGGLYRVDQTGEVINVTTNGPWK